MNVTLNESVERVTENTERFLTMVNLSIVDIVNIQRFDIKYKRVASLKEGTNVRRD